MLRFLTLSAHTVPGSPVQRFFTKSLHSHLAVGSQGHVAIVEALLILWPPICAALATTSCSPTRPLFVY